MIDSFFGEHAFLSNFYYRPFIWSGYCVATSEHAFQMCKAKFCLTVEQTRIQRANIAMATTARNAKIYGKGLEIDKAGWEANKVSAMRAVLKRKFDTQDDLRAKLIATSPHELVEGNTWGDKIWGKVDNVGQNLLGCLLMELRGYYINGTAAVKRTFRLTAKQRNMLDESPSYHSVLKFASKNRWVDAGLLLKMYGIIDQQQYFEASIYF